MIQVVHPGSGSRIRILIFFTHPGSRIRGFKKEPDFGSRIRNTAYSTVFLMHLLYSAVHQATQGVTYTN
jgi:hypothetical protein